jgi:tetratricopeptide (TPR) repeat protein
MNAFNVRAVVSALFLGLAVIAGTGVATVTPADAGVRPAVGKPLQEAQSLAASGNYSAAMAKVNQAEGVGGLTGEESRIISQMRAYISSKSSSSGGKGKFSNDYRSGRWSAVIADAQSMRGELDANDHAAVATAYYKLGQNKECVRYIKDHFGNGGSDIVLKIQMACAFGAGDDAAQTDALEQLVSRSQSPEYWGLLLKSAERTPGLNDHQTLDIYRLRFRTGTMATADQYTLLAKLAISMGFPAEAAAIEQKGVEAKLLSGDTFNRLAAMTQTQAAQQQASLAQRMAAAQKAPNGDPLVKIGEELWGQGKFSDALGAIQAGIKKDKIDMNNAQIRLGMAYLGAGQKDAAVRAFGKVSGDAKWTTMARIWSLYAKK